MGKSASEYVVQVRERAHAIWEREGRPEGRAEHHWAQAEEELRAEAPGGEARTEEEVSAGGGSAAPPTGDPADPDAPGRQPDPAGEGRHWWEKDAAGHRADREQTNMAPDDLRSNEL